MAINGTPKGHYEADRLRELHKYFQANNRDAPPSSPQVGGDPVQDNIAAGRNLPDTTLTALLQLIAVRLSKQRAIVSLVDKNDQYFIAESTRTGNLRDPSIYEDEADYQWQGCTGSTIRGEALCTNTIVAEDVPGGYPIFVVTDLPNDPRFAQLPYVCAPPYFRYYAGTPLVTKSGFRIGSVFVIDDRAQPAPNVSEVEFLGIMASNIMNHLEMQKASLEQKRQNTMSRGLAAFVEGKTKIPLAWMRGSVFDTATSDSHAESPSKVNPAENGFGRRKSTVSQSPNLTNEPERASTKQVFSRAANLLRESLDVDHVLFLQAHKGLQTTQKASLAEIVGCSSSDHSSASGNDLNLNLRVPRKFLESLSTQYAQGKIWTYREDGTYMYGDEGILDLTHESVPVLPSDAMNEPETDTENDTLLQCFPRARQILYSPLWGNEVSERISGCLIVSEHELPVFTTDVEVPFVRAFVNSVAIICGQLNAILGEEQKAAFISSMSHELRSPLHGILASTELLSQTNLDLVQRDLCSNVDVCGQTLLDTISQILDYSKINKFLDGKQARASQGSEAHGITESTASIQGGSSLSTYSECDLALLCEETLNVVALAFKQTLASDSTFLSAADPTGSPAHRSSKKGISSVLVDFSASQNNWIYICSPGAIRRIVMNLVGNSLKYTSHGSVSVSLVLKQTLADNKDTGIPTRTEESTMLLSVADTGQGMSHEFLSTKLFVPFSQESSLVPGSGLGLSLVNGIVKSLGGSISVQSEVGKGTTFEVLLPLSTPKAQSHILPYGPDPTKCSPVLQSNYVNTTFRMFGSSSTSGRVKGSLRFYMQQWWKAREVDEASSANVIFVNEGDLQNFIAQGGATKGPHAAIVLFVSAPVNDVRRMGSLNGVVLEPLIIPFGPNKLLKALQAVFDRAPDPPGQPVPSKTEHYNQSSIEEVTKKESKLLSGGTAPIRPSFVVRETQSFSDENLQTSSTSMTRPLPYRGTTTKARAPQSYLSPRQPTSVLCVDDNSMNLKLLRAYVRKLGFDQVETAGDGLEAFKIVKQSTGNFGLIFMDLTMPVCDGFESTRLIREFEWERKARDGGVAEKVTPAVIVALTGLASGADQEKAFSAGIDHFVTKPLRYKDLEVMLTRWNILG